MRPGFSTGNIRELDMLVFLFVCVFNHLVIKRKTKRDDCVNTLTLNNGNFFRVCIELTFTLQNSQDVL